MMNHNPFQSCIGVNVSTTSPFFQGKETYARKTILQ